MADGGQATKHLPDGINCRALDPGIASIVITLNEHAVETFESCEGGPGHSFPEPTVRFHGSRAEGFRALAVALQNGMRVSQLRRCYDIDDGELVGPCWELTFRVD